MKSLIFTFFLICSSSLATQLGLFTVRQPLYLHGSDGDVQIQITEVPFASSNSSPEAEFAAISQPFVPPTDGSWKRQGDVNLASLYNIKVSVEVASSGAPEHWIITIDASKAKIPEGYPFTIIQVTDAVVTCVKLMRPTKPESERTLTINIVKPTK